jgi:hypothetical protein
MTGPVRPERFLHKALGLLMKTYLLEAQCAVRRGLTLDRDALDLGDSSFSGLPIRLRTASRTLARPFARILSFRAAMMLTTSGFALPSVGTSI